MHMLMHMHMKVHSHYARSMYVSVSVLSTTLSPTLMWDGTRTLWPVDSTASLPESVTEAPFRDGSHSWARQARRQAQLGLNQATRLTTTSRVTVLGSRTRTGAPWYVSTTNVMPSCR